MEIGSLQWQQTVIDGARALRLTAIPNELQLEQLMLHGREMLRWNKRVNLTRIVDPGQIAVKHIVDSMAGLRVLPKRGRLLDVGSGAGYPGLVLKIMAPGLAITLVDGKRKKIHFLKYMLRELGLTKISAEHTRVEQMPFGRRRGFDMVVSRAVGDIVQLVTMVHPYLAEDGMLAAYKGVVDRLALRASVKELNEKGRAVEKDSRFWHLTAYHYELPGDRDQRHLVVADRRKTRGREHLKALA